MRKLLIALMCVVMTIAMMPAMAFAAEGDAGAVTLIVGEVANDDAERADQAKYNTLSGALGKAVSGDTIKLEKSITVDNLTIDKDVTITAEQGVNITINNGKTLTIDANVKFTGFTKKDNNMGVLVFNAVSNLTITEGKTAEFTGNTHVTTVLVSGTSADNKVTVNGTLNIHDNEGGGSNGGTFEVGANGKVIANNNSTNGLTGKVTMKNGGSIEATGNGQRGITLNGGSTIEAGTVVANGNGKGEKGGSDIEVNTNTGTPGLDNVTFGGTANIDAGTMAGYSAVDRDIVVKVEGNAIVNIKKTAGEGKNETAELFKQDADTEGGKDTDTFTSGTLIMPNVDGELQAEIKGTNINTVEIPAGVDKVVVKGTLEKNAVIKVPAGTVVKNESAASVKVETPNGTLDVENGKEITAQNPPIYIPVGPVAPSVQKPVIEPNADVTTSLSADGTTLSVTAKDGFEIVDVTVNGVSKGAVTTVTGLKTGDKVVIVTKAIEEPTAAEKKIAACKETKLIARSQAVKTKSGKKAIKITWKAKEGSLKNLDGVQIFRSTKRADGTYKKVFTSKSGKYINTSVKKGQMYYYKVRGYVRVDGKLYFTKYSTKAWRRV